MTNNAIASDVQNTIILYYPQKETPARNGARFFDKVKFIPGRNSLSSEALRMARKSPLFDSYLAAGIITIIQSESEEDDDIKDVIVNDLSIVNALPIIRGEKDIKNLEEWLKIEMEVKKRDKVVKAITRRIETIRAGDI